MHESENPDPADCQRQESEYSQLNATERDEQEDEHHQTTYPANVVEGTAQHTYQLVSHIISGKDKGVRTDIFQQRMHCFRIIRLHIIHNPVAFIQGVNIS